VLAADPRSTVTLLYGNRRTDTVMFADELADLRAEANLRPLLAGSGWRMTSYVDGDDRFLALATRTS
ncbi:hypothetical protein ACWDRX_28320, partial [Streptomyces nigra]